ncbi:hypothetical protein LCGC14_0373880 [marine sediment metagenome]|uniref:Uncharacterized protein n=1 Tax=marine sediment metagenome TaxID=412755 RepID=A0A0F9TML3_9ZZZZ
MSEESQDISSRIDRIEVTLSHAVDAIDKIASIVNRPVETKWGPILTAIALLLAAGGGYTTLITIPMEREADRLQIELHEMGERELEVQRALGRLEGLAEKNDG